MGFDRGRDEETALVTADTRASPANQSPRNGSQTCTRAFDCFVKLSVLFFPNVVLITRPSSRRVSMFPFRPIAPAPPSPSLPARDPSPMDLYAASCNPARRAKRARPDDSPPYPHPVRDSPSPSTDNPDDAPYDIPQPSPPKRRGRKPGTISRAAREAQRKINHSLIEKARRTKINDALATLRKLVPAHYKRSSADDHHHQDESDDDQDNGINRSKQQKSKGSGEKEFKLEILVRTVAYLQDLTERAESLERDGCPHCSKSISSLRDGAPLRRTDEPVAAPPAAPASTSRLPSISTWLPTLTPSQSPSCDLPVPSPSPCARSAIASVGANISSHQLPTPPGTSAAFTSSSTVVGVLPALTLPSPRTLLPSARSLHGLLHPTPGTHGTNANIGISSGGKNKGSPAASPVYTPEDETAASLLLRMSTSSNATSPTLSTSPQTCLNRLRSSSSASLTSMWLNPAVDVGYGGGGGGVASRSDQAESGPRDTRSALTPSRLLGLATRRSEVSDAFNTLVAHHRLIISHSR